MSKVIKTVLTVVFIAAFATVAFFLLTQNHQQRENQQAQSQEILNNGLETIGVPVDIEMRSETRTGDRPTKDYYTVVYSYTVDGKEYTVKGREHDDMFAAEDEKSSGEKTVRYLENAPEQSRVIVFIN